ncbi:MAG: aminoglycoside phosphotransferase family protein [Nitrospiraceae bacterium]|nr:aminoglycoside phosphotransferase family protein [Nitrospiraceae bacterium]
MEPVRPYLPKQLSAEVVRREVEKLYGFSSVDVPRLINGGQESAAWHFKTDRGDWVVKIYAPHDGRFERVTREPVLYAYLNQHGIRAPRVVQSKRAQLAEELRADAQIYPVMVMQLEDLRFTRPASIQKEELMSIARTVGQMHQCLRCYPGHENALINNRAQSHRGVISSVKKIAMAAARLYQPFKGNSPCGYLMINKELVGYDLLVVSPAAASFTREELSHMLILDRQMKAYLSGHAPLSHLTESLIHGDLGLQHAPFLPSGDIYLFDFGDHSWGTVAEELAGMLVSLCIDDVITLDRWERLREWTLDGYASQFQLTPGDAAAVLPFIIRRLLVAITYGCEMPAEMQGEGWRQRMKRRYQLADYLLQSKAFSTS